MYSILLITDKDDNFYDLKIKCSDEEIYKKKFNLVDGVYQKVYHMSNMDGLIDILQDKFFVS